MSQLKSEAIECLSPETWESVIKHCGNDGTPWHYMSVERLFEDPDHGKRWIQALNREASTRGCYVVRDKAHYYICKKPSSIPGPLAAALGPLLGGRENAS